MIRDRLRVALVGVLLLAVAACVPPPHSNAAPKVWPDTIPEGVRVENLVIVPSASGLRDVSFQVVDTRGRQAPNTDKLAERRIYVRAWARAVNTGALGLLVHGTYRQGDAPIGVPSPTPDPGDNRAEVWISFPLMDRVGFTPANWRDIPNHPGDVTTVLDVLSADDTLIGRLGGPIAYLGASMGGITGIMFANESGLDPRIDTVLAYSGFAPSASTMGFPAPYAFDKGPKILMINGMQDPTITYELARSTTQLPGWNGTFVSVPEAGHGGVVRCPQLQSVVDRFVEETFVPAAPGRSITDPAVITAVLRNSCAVPGVQPGGTTGPGATAGV